jgi:hypothetical protein
MTNCPKCNHAITVLTNNCHKRNPIFSCQYGLKNVAHMHFWCVWCTHSWVEVRSNVNGLSVGPDNVAPGAQA